MKQSIQEMANGLQLFFIDPSPALPFAGKGACFQIYCEVKSFFAEELKKN